MVYRLLCADNSGAQVAFVICSYGMCRMALSCETTSQTSVHFAVNAGYKAFNFKIINAQFDLGYLIVFHKIVFNNYAYCYGVSAYPLIAQCFYSLMPANILQERGAPSM